MRKYKIALLYNILLLLFSCLVHAQDYIPLLGETNSWYHLIAPESAWTDVYITKGDSIIEGKSYKILGARDYDNIFGYLREDTIARKVYIKYGLNASTEESIYYDFSLKENDSILLVQYGTLINKDTLNWYYIDSIRSIQTLIDFRRIFYLHGYYMWNKTVYTEYPVWIEGVGTIGDPLRPMITPEWPGWYGGLSCFFKDGVKIYQSEFAIEFDTCEIGWSSTENPNSSDIITVFPNPANNILFIDISTNENFTLYLYNVKGQKILELFKPKEVVIDYLQNGFYFLHFVFKKRTITKKIIVDKNQHSLH